MIEPSRSEVWMVNLDPTKGREQAGSRPALIVSVNQFNHGASELIIVCPLTSKDKNIPTHIKITPPEGGLALTSFVKCEDVRSISKSRLSRFLGEVGEPTMNEVEDRLGILLGI
ncbi:MAG: type II toxin-antitoxin system PemK/MazF family toxin [Acidobacteriota bacterium]|nr:type II toxin-antitoxin system PemK/MazF family toxin [Acidobacteriota bacterium]